MKLQKLNKQKKKHKGVNKYQMKLIRSYNLILTHDINFGWKPVTTSSILNYNGEARIRHTYKRCTNGQ